MSDPKLSYSDHIRHYQLDGRYYDFFEPDRFMVQESRRRYQEIFHCSLVKSGDKILEIGSGGGFALENFHRVFPHYFPLDIPHNNLIRIRHNAAFPVYPCASDAYHLPFICGTFNVVILAEVLEHLADPQAVLAEIYRVIANKGKVAISVPYREKISYQICIHCNRPTPTHSHLHSFDIPRLSDLLAETGFIPIHHSKNCNKIPNRLHLNILLRSLPFSLWKIMDHFFNYLIDKPISLIMIGQKQEIARQS